MDDDGFNRKIGDEGCVEDDVVVETSGDGCQKASDGTLSRLWKFCWMPSLGGWEEGETCWITFDGLSIGLNETTSISESFSSDSESSLEKCESLSSLRH